MGWTWKEKTYEELVLQAILHPPPLTWGCSEGLDAFRCFFQQFVVVEVGGKLQNATPRIIQLGASTAAAVRTVVYMSAQQQFYVYCRVGIKRI